MANKVQFLGFKRVSQSVFDAVTAQKKEQYMWFVKPDGDTVNESGDIYLGSFHYGHYGHADADNIQQLWETLGGMFSNESGNTVSDYVKAIQDALGEGFVDASGNSITFTEAINNNTELINEVDNEWRRVVGNGFVDDAIVVDGQRFFEGETVSNVVCANTMALLIEIDEDIVVTNDSLSKMVEEGSASNVADALSKLLATGNVVLDEDLMLPTNVVVEDGVSTTLDLSGHKLYNENDIWDAQNDVWSLVSVRGGELVVKGGTFQTKENDEYAIDVRDGGKVVVEDGEFIGNIHAIYVHTGSADIRGGKFSVQQVFSAAKPYEYTINLYDESRKEGTASAVVTGGSFYKFNPSDNASEGAHTNYVPEGYKVVEDGDWFNVVAE